MRSDTIRQPVSGPADLGQALLKGVFSQTYPAGVRIEHKYALPNEQALLFSARGDVALTIDDGAGVREIELPEGCCILLSESQLKALLPRRDWTSHWYNFFYSSIDMLPRLTVFDAPPAADTQHALDEILSLATAHQLWARRRATALFMDLLTRVLASNAFQPVPTDDAHAIHRVTEYLSNHLHRVVTVEEMAEVAGMSLSTFRTRFKRVMGVTYKVYYDNQRIEAAQRLLIEGCTVKHTAAQLGYSDQFHFSRAFRRVCGRSPSEVILIHKQRQEARRSTSPPGVCDDAGG